jgi:large subunit ribosomal protein L21
MFAVVRTGGKQYRVAAGDKIVVERLPGEAGDTIQLGDILLAGEGSELRSTDGLSVAAEIIAQAKGEKVTVFKKRRRHNYRRKKGHRQLHTILKIVSIGSEQAKGGAKKAAKPAPAEEAPATAPAAEAPATKAAPAKKAKPKKDESGTSAATEARTQAPLKLEGAESEMTDTPVAAKAPRKAAKKDGGKGSKAK